MIIRFLFSTFLARTIAESSSLSRYTRYSWMHSVKPRSAYAARTCTTSRALSKGQRGRVVQTRGPQRLGSGPRRMFLPPVWPPPRIIVFCLVHRMLYTAHLASSSSLGRRTISSTAPFSLPPPFLSLSISHCARSRFRSQSGPMWIGILVWCSAAASILNIFDMMKIFLIFNVAKTLNFFYIEYKLQIYALYIFIIYINPIHLFEKRIKNFYITIEIQAFKVFSKKKMR